MLILSSNNFVGLLSMKTCFASVLILLVALGCASEKELNQGEGYADVTGGKIWYKVVGEGNKTPLLLLHGGPGIPSYYLNPLSAISEDRPVILFDQLGCGRSTRHTDTTLMTIKTFSEQLEQLRLKLGLKEFYLYGSSWGTMLGADYYFRYPDAVKAIIFSSPCLSAKMWSADADTLIATLPDSIQLAITGNTAKGAFDSPDYIRATEFYYKNFVTRTPSADIDSSFANYNKTIYEYMWGPSEFTATGTLKHYDATTRLPEIKIPTLFIAGEFDEARPSTVRYYQSLVPNARFVLIKNAGHLTMQDNPQQDILAIRTFLNALESD